MELLLLGLKTRLTLLAKIQLLQRVSACVAVLVASILHRLIGSLNKLGTYISGGADGRHKSPKSTAHAHIPILCSAFISHVTKAERFGSSWTIKPWIQQESGGDLRGNRKDI